MKTCKLSFLIVLLAVMLVSHLQAQNVNFDSLEVEAKNTKLPVSERIRIYDDLSWFYLDYNFEKSVKAARSGIALASKEHDDKMSGTLYRNLGVAFYMNTQYDTAKVYLDIALNYAEKAKDEQLKAAIYGAIANMYNATFDYTKAIDFYLKTAALSEQQGNIQRLATIYANMGGIYINIAKFDLAEKYTRKAEQLHQKLNDKSGVAQCKKNLSEIYYMQKDYSRSKAAIDKSIALYKELNNPISEINALDFLARIYSDEKNHQKAIATAEQSIKLARQTGYNKTIMEALRTLGFVYMRQGNVEEANKYTLEALNMADSTQLLEMAQLYSQMIENSMKAGNTEDALYNLRIYRTLEAAIFNQNMHKSISEMEVKYETEKKEAKIATLEKEKRLYTWLGIAGAAVLVLLVFVLFFRQRWVSQKKKLVEQKVKELEQEKQLVSIQAVLDGETAERTRLARDLHDGLGSMLSVVKLGLNELKTASIVDGSDAEQFNKAMGLLDNSIRELRRVAHNMMPESLTRYGLKVSLTDFCGSIPHAAFNYYGKEERLDPKLEVMVYRTAHELVNNALKHAEAQKIDVQIVQESDRISLTVHDDGKGFNTTAETKGSGLANIRHRVGSYNGSMDIWSEAGKGTEVSVEFKLQ